MTGPALAASACSFEPQGEGRVSAIIDARTFRMDDGREVRLAGIETVDGPASADGVAALAPCCRPQCQLARRDRCAENLYGRQPAFVFVEQAAAPVQNQLLTRDVAPVSGTVADKACAAELAAAEAAARRARRGIWADRAAIKNAESPGELLARIGQFTVVEGKVLSVRQAGATSYINFGRRWTRDFAVTISRRVMPTFEAAGFSSSRSKTNEFGSAAGSRRAAGRGSRRSGWGRLRWPATIRPAGQRQMTTVKRRLATARDFRWPPRPWRRPSRCARRSCLPAVVISAGSRPQPPASLPRRKRLDGGATPAAEKEHERILSSYGGAYDDPRLEALITNTVDRLVAASDRPDLAYRVTILNSGAVNAFALPTGQLYVTRGLIALASDTSELSSAPSHEMAHVLAKHASIREDQARQAAIVTRVVTDMGNDPDLDRTRAGQDKTDHGELFAGAGIRGRRHRSRDFRPRAFRSLWRLALFDRDGTQCRDEGRQGLAGSALAGFSVVASGDARAGAERAGQCAAIHLAAGRRAGTARLIWPPSTTSSMAKTRARDLSAAAASCIQSSASPSRRRSPSRWTTPRRR